MSFIEFKNICKKYAGNDKNSVTNFNLDIEEIWDYFVENYFLPIAFLNTEIPKNKKWAAYHTHCWNRQTP